MKSIRALLVLGVLVTLVLFLFTLMSGSAAVYASSSVGDAKAGPPGVALLADQLPVSESNSAIGSIRGFGGGGSWTLLSNMKKSVKQVNGGGYAGGYIYIPGGVIGGAGPSFYNSMQFFEIATNRWRVEAELMPTTVADAAICTDDAGKIHVINGFDTGLALTSSHMIYDTNAPSGSRWSTVSAPVVAGDNYFSQGSGCAVIDHILYLFGGLGNIGAGSPAALSATWAWNPMTDTWSDTGFSMNTARYWFGYDDKSNAAYVAGGRDTSGPTPFASTERFFPGSGWQTLMSLPMGLLAPGLVGTESGPMVFGGAAYIGSVYVLQAATYICAGSCPPSAPWTNTSTNLNTARWFAGYAGGPPDGPFIAGGHVSGNGSLKTSEMFQAP
jgi:hypothetical protein